MSFSISHIHDLLDQTFTWQVVVTNNGPNTARDVVVDIDIPVGVSYLTYTATSGAYEPSQHKYYAGNIATDTSKTITFTLRTVSVPNDDLQFTATVTALGVDSDLDNNVFQYTLPFLPLYTNQVTTVDLKIWLNGTESGVFRSATNETLMANPIDQPANTPFTGQVSDTGLIVSPHLRWRRFEDGEYVGDQLIIPQPGEDALVEWVFVWIEQNGVIRQTRSGLLKANGHIVGLDGASVLSFDVEPGDYRIGLKIRGSLNYGPIKYYTFNGNPISLDLTNGSVPLRGGGNSHRLIDGKYCLVLGDLNLDGVISSDDFDLWEEYNGSSSNLTEFEQRLTDINRDGSIDSIDSINIESAMAINGGASF